ncbi:hypothetical protein DV702_03760 [Sporosarcina sp. PTS2304]|uniref:anti sigma factor C-terminal domain-containing protein n=1 Tax=Sporosarcina sp. PTS2304 TaxID=2283194 RepID=UPI000E0DAD23|nr:anti sigma factor C-terminal domain-containing protein [Sporosarcina sp. PTS2304]AXH98921.1 hypothetical protein DV702_03760 [Sporosarcina sp. PTS2304]
MEFFSFDWIFIISFAGFVNLLDAKDSLVVKGIDDIEVLGVVMYGTKEEIEKVSKQPFVKAVSLGGVIDNY